jgi:beta-glucosidase
MSFSPFKILIPALVISILLICPVRAIESPADAEERAKALLSQMTLKEKIGQLVQKNAGEPGLESLIRDGMIGSVLNQPDPALVFQMQRIAVEESRLGIPLLIGRDVIHGFRTIMPIPLGQAASWNVDLVEHGARIAALEAASQGIRWTFSPMIDVTRDPRWGRIAESFGEDHYLNGVFGAAMVRGYQGEDLSDPASLAACVKHFAAYGWAEGGRDYNTANIPYNELHDVILPPFRMTIEAGAATIMTAFNEINGIPASGHAPLLRDLLRHQWGFQGLVLSDWQSVTQMVIHGYTPNYKEAAYRAMQATLDMEMVSPAYERYLEELILEGRISEQQIDEAVMRVLILKFKLGLFDAPYAHLGEFPELLNPDHLEVARKMAIESTVLLKNEGILPIRPEVRSITVIGPMADAAHDQLGTWIFDGRKEDAITPLQSFFELADANEELEVFYHPGLALSRSTSITNPEEMMEDVERSDMTILFLGEESILSGEAHSLANLDLQGAQNELVKLVASAGKPVVAVIMAGRPLTFEKAEPYLDAILYAWHPGTMAGPAITDLLFGKESPSGKLPVTFPRHVGQIPMYYNHKNTGKPATDESWVRLEDIPAEAVQYSLGNTSHYLDYGFEPMYPFGFGLSYSAFEFDNFRLNKNRFDAGEHIQATVTLTNTGDFRAAEVVQLYTRQLFGSRTRPVRELKAFQKVELAPGESREITFELNTMELAFHDAEMQFVVEPGPFHIWIGNSSRADMKLEFEISR